MAFPELYEAEISIQALNSRKYQELTIRKRELQTEMMRVDAELDACKAVTSLFDSLINARLSSNDWEKAYEERKNENS